MRVFTAEDGYLTVENRLQKKAGSDGNRTGIRNIQERYQFFTDKKVIITEGSATFTVRLPLLTD